MLHYALFSETRYQLIDDDESKDESENAMGASRSGISVSNEASKVLRGAEAVPYTRSELEAEVCASREPSLPFRAPRPITQRGFFSQVEKTLTSLFIGDRDDVAFEELYAQMFASQSGLEPIDAIAIIRRCLLAFCCMCRCESDERVMASGKDAVTAALDAMETANKVCDPHLPTQPLIAFSASLSNVSIAGDAPRGSHSSHLMPARKLPDFLSLPFAPSDLKIGDAVRCDVTDCRMTR